MRRTAAPLALTTTTLALSVGLATTASAQDAEVPEPDPFTSMFTVMATPDAVVNAESAPAPGESGATGTFDLRINSDEEIICYDIVLDGVTPPFMSPARTATHIHQAAEGAAGPPRIAFPDPEDAGDGTLRSEGCLQGPFTTGILADGTDTGTGFSLAEIEADPSAFAADSHTADFTAGVVRGQLTSVPMGGVDTGAGGAAGPGAAPVALGAAALLGLAGVGTVLVRRRAQG